MIQRSRTAVVYECSICGHKVIVDYNLGQGRPEKCEKCGRQKNEGQE